jgi:hypothetical protein
MTYKAEESFVALVEKSLLRVSDYQDALNSQSACNVTGLIQSMAKITECLWHTAWLYNKGTEWVNHHPILQLYAYQLATLSHRREPMEWDGWMLANAFCNDVVKGTFKPETDYQLIYTDYKV